jgi:hypothetical protein
MAIDDPISALESLNASDERQRSPVSRLSKPFLAIAKLMVPGAVIGLAGVEAAENWVDGRAESNRQELGAILADELKHAGAMIQKIILASEAQKRFVEDELPGLTVDALRRAEQCRAKDRIARLARILAHAAEIGARDGADLVEEMMTVATGLSELDVLILRQALLEYHAETSTHKQEAQRAVAQRAWLRVSEKAGIPDDEMASVGSKLASFGLAARVETGQPWAPPIFRPLERGDKFIEYIRSGAR